MDHRVAFDFEIEFTNGGGLQGHDFRLDVPAEDVTDAWIGDALVRDLRLLMVGDVRIRNRRIIEEPHKRGLEPAPSGGAAPTARRLVDLSHPIVEGMTTYPGLPVPEIRPHLTREASTAHYAPGVTFAIDVITLCGNTGTYVDSPFHRYGRRAGPRRAAARAAGRRTRGARRNDRLGLSRRRRSGARSPTTSPVARSSSTPDTTAIGEPTRTAATTPS